MNKISNILYWLSGEKGFSWLKEKKFWVFFFIQATLWLLFYWNFGAESVFKINLMTGELVNLPVPRHLTSILFTSGCLFILSIFTAAILPKTNFFVLVIYVLGNYFKSWGFLIAGIWWALRKFKPINIGKKIFIGFIAYLIFGLITALPYLIASIIILIKIVFNY